MVWASLCVRAGQMAQAVFQCWAEHNIYNMWQQPQSNHYSTETMLPQCQALRAESNFPLISLICEVDARALVKESKSFVVNEKFSGVLHLTCFSQEAQAETVWELVSLRDRQTDMFCSSVLSALSIYSQMNTHNRWGCPNRHTRIFTSRIFISRIFISRIFISTPRAAPLRRYRPKKWEF